MKKQISKEIKEGVRSLMQQLHDARICAHMTLEQVNEITKIPIHIIDKLEIGIKQMQLSDAYVLAKAYNKKVQINLVDRD